jgi:hypothetical protein
MDPDAVVNRCERSQACSAVNAYRYRSQQNPGDIRRAEAKTASLRSSVMARPGASSA